MRIISGSTDFVLEGKSAVAIGKFDGIHRGHLALMNHILEQKNEGMQAVVFTFDPPATVFFGRGGEKELTTLAEKRRFFESLGIDVLIEFPLNKETAAIEAEDFVKEILVKQIQAAYIAAGTDLSFGYKGRGDSVLLSALGEQFGYRVEIIDKLFFEEREISSTYVREEVLLGNMETVRELLGRPYSITGKVEQGKKLGRTLGMPTVNLYPPEGKLLPRKGVYFSETRCNGIPYKSITNIGLKPTVNDTPAISVESYLYDFEGDLYGEEIETFLLAFKRPEMKFDSVDALKAQMLADVEEGRHW
ncbi:MAG: bifunctional riboflavin kinase/FAD synthetase [Lachnospiraceae bacterium]|nr:bifunctional riboflavin kinase/FAD synthetase [Lachnospiraceae bacterium]